MSRTFAKRVVNQYLGWVHTMRFPKCKHNVIANAHPKYCDELNVYIKFRTPTVVTSWDDIYSTKRRVKNPIESKCDNNFWVNTDYTPSVEQRIARLQVYIQDAETSLDYHTKVLERLSVVNNDLNYLKWYDAKVWKYKDSLNTINNLKRQLTKFNLQLDELKKNRPKE